MKTVFVILITGLLAAASVLASELNPTPFPVFLKYGFSSVLEFEDTPVRVVLGDSQNFQVEKLNHSLVIKTLTAYASSNMFVYFETKPTRVFVLTASEDAEPTYYRKFESPLEAKPAAAEKGPVFGLPRTRIVRSRFDVKKDYLTVEVLLSSTSLETTRPNWDLIRLRFGSTAIAPSQLWAERKEIQKDSQVRARFIFAKPSLPRSLAGAVLVIPLHTSPNPIRLVLGGRQ